ncbi:MAG: penicillin-binding protein activator, partial [Endozoicomonas sp.]
ARLPMMNSITTLFKRLKVEKLQEKLPAIVVAFLIPVLISACSSTKVGKPTSTLTQQKNIDQQLANISEFSYPERATLTLELTSQLATENPTQAKQILDQLPYDQLPESIQAKLAIQQAQLAQASNKDWAIFDWLDRKAIIVSNDRFINAQAYILKAMAYARFGEYQASLDEWILAAPYLTDAEKQSHYVSFWQTLLHVPAERLRILYQQERSSPMRGWLSLALIYQTGQTFDQQLADFEQWKQEWTSHPAQQFLPTNFELLKNSSTERPDRIAVLLPLTGRLEKMGIAVRDGMMAAHFEAVHSGAPLTELRFYDTQGSNINELALLAISEGAQLIIGPLNKTHVRELGKDIPARVPVLALNYVDDTTITTQNQLQSQPHKLYQFGLSAEDEAVLAAHRAIIDGHKRAVIITPKTEWGKRINITFQNEWQALGGEIVASGEFDAQTQFSSLAGWLLHTDQSEARAKQLNRLLGEKLGFQARRRQDIDTVFIGATPQEARQIKPALAYQYASGIPVYATSSVFSGVTNKTQDQDMNGIRVPIMPWLIPETQLPLKQQITNQWQQSRSQLGTLYALGVDAYNLHPRLQQLITLQGSQLQGVTGSLSIKPSGKVHRELSWQVFKNGRLFPLPIVEPKITENPMTISTLDFLPPEYHNDTTIDVLETEPQE